MGGIEEMIRQRAYRLWDRAGRPYGRGEEFWRAAKADVERKEGAEAGKLSRALPRRPEARGEAAGDWNKRRRDPSF